MSKIFNSIKVPNYVKGYVDHSFNISDRISEIMNDKGITQKELAKRLGKSESEISKWMTGQHNFTIKSIAKIEDALDEKIIKTTSGNDSSTKIEYFKLEVTQYSDVSFSRSESPFSGSLRCA